MCSSQSMQLNVFFFLFPFGFAFAPLELILSGANQWEYKIQGRGCNRQQAGNNKVSPLFPVSLRFCFMRFLLIQFLIFIFPSMTRKDNLIRQA